MKVITIHDEELAIIAHEIGHLAARLNELKLDDYQEEVYADQCAVKLGFRKEMKSGLQKKWSMLI